MFKFVDKKANGSPARLSTLKVSFDPHTRSSKNSSAVGTPSGKNDIFEKENFTDISLDITPKHKIDTIKEISHKTDDIEEFSKQFTNLDSPFKKKTTTTNRRGHKQRHRSFNTHWQKHSPRLILAVNKMTKENWYRHKGVDKSRDHSKEKVKKKIFNSS